MEIADTPENEQTEEDLIINEAIKVVITKELDAEANLTNGETFMEAHKAVTKEQSRLPFLATTTSAAKTCQR